MHKEIQTNREKSPDTKLDGFAPEREVLAEEVVVDTTTGSTDVLTEQMKAQDKSALLDLMQKDNLDFKTIEDIQKVTEKYGNIMDKWGLDTVLGRIPGGNAASGVFSTLFFLYQGQKLPNDKKLPMKDVLKIFGLQVVDKMGTGAAKVVGAGGGAVVGGIVGTFLIPIPIAGTAAGAALGGVGGYAGGGTLFDYFFKANKWSANIFKKHCDTLKTQAQDRNNTVLYSQLTQDATKIEQKFSGGGEKGSHKPSKIISINPDNSPAKVV